MQKSEVVSDTVELGIPIPTSIAGTSGTSGTSGETTGDKNLETSGNMIAPQPPTSANEERMTDSYTPSSTIEAPTLRGEVQESTVADRDADTEGGDKVPARLEMEMEVSESASETLIVEVAPVSIRTTLEASMSFPSPGLEGGATSAKEVDVLEPPPPPASDSDVPAAVEQDTPTAREDFAPGMETEGKGTRAMSESCPESESEYEVDEESELEVNIGSWLVINVDEVDVSSPSSSTTAASAGLEDTSGILEDPDSDAAALSSTDHCQESEPPGAFDRTTINEEFEPSKTRTVVDDINDASVLPYFLLRVHPLNRLFI